MSRSYKRTPYQGQKQDRKDKRNANKAVRHRWDIGDGGDYKRVFSSYDIRDYGWPLFPGDHFDDEEIYKYMRK